MPRHSAGESPGKRNHWRTFLGKKLLTQLSKLKDYYPLPNSSGEFLFIMATRMYYSSMSTFIYAFVLLVNLFVIYRAVVTKDVDWILLLADCFVSFMLIFEIVLRVTISGSLFFQEACNIFDVLIAVLCITLLIGSKDLWSTIVVVSKEEKEDHENTMDLVQQSSTAVRFLIQLLRTIPLMMHCRRSKLPSDQVDFSLIKFRARFDDGL